MVGWHHRLNGHEFEQTPGDSEGQGSTCMQSMGLQRVGHNLETNGLHELKGGFMTEPQQQSCVWFRGPLIHLLQVVMKTMNKKIVSFPPAY